VRPLTESEEPVVEMVSAPTLEVIEAIVDSAQGQEETEWETILVSQPLSPTSTAAMAVAAGGGEAKKQIRLMHEDANEILMMLEKTMEKVCEWSNRIEAQDSVTVELDVQV
jgi:hypothetical protein